MFIRNERQDKGKFDLRLDGEMVGDKSAEDGELVEDEVLEDEPEDMDADLESQAADYMADNDVWMYGPNAGAVLEILDTLEDVVPADARLFAECWLEIPKSDRDQARKASRKLAENDEDLYRYLQLAREGVATWLAVKSAYPEYVSAEPNWGRISTQTGEAALDAVTAVILEGKLSEENYEALLEPWSEASAELDAAREAAALEGPEDEDLEDEDAEEAEDEQEGEFGPNSTLVSDFITRLWLLTPEQVGRLVGSWQNTSRDELKVAHENLRTLIEEDSEYRDQVRAAQEKLSEWLNASRFSEQTGFLGATGVGDTRKMAGPTLADAVAALVLGDLMDRPDAEVLYGPWFHLVGAPPLPDPAPEDDGKHAKAKAPAKSAAKSAAKPAPKSAKQAAPAKPAAPAKSAAKPAPKSTSKSPAQAPAAAKKPKGIKK
jgi:chemotaxis protein histidine kinase CheA